MAFPRIAITAGDPAGIGPEIARKAIVDSRVRDVCEPLYYGSEQIFEPGVLSAEAGHAAYETIVRAVRDAQAGGIHAIATAPINKEALARAGLPWRGHTEMLASLTNAPRVAMMFWSEKLRVVLATIHIPIAAVPAALTVESVCAIIELTDRELPRFGLPHARLALAGLNPHAGEHGVLGREEIDVLEPAVARANGIGIMKNAQNPNAAALFEDYMLSEAQTVLASLNYVPTSTKVESPLKGIQIKIVDPAETLDNSAKWEPLYQQIVVKRSP